MSEATQRGESQILAGLDKLKSVIIERDRQLASLKREVEEARKDGWQQCRAYILGQAAKPQPSGDTDVLAAEYARGWAECREAVVKMLRDEMDQPEYWVNRIRALTPPSAGDEGATNSE